MRVHRNLGRNLGLALVAAAFLTVAGCSSEPAEQQAPVAQKAPAPKPAPAPAAKPAAAAKAIPMVSVPKGTALSASLGQTLTSTKSKVGDTFAATLTVSVKLGSDTVLPKGAKLSGKIVAIKKHDIKVALTSVTLKGKSYPLETNSVGAPAKAQVQNAKASDKNKDVTVIAAKTNLSFKLAKAASVPAPPKAKPAKTAKSTKSASTKKSS